MTVVTRCQILRLKCTKFDFGWGSAPDPAGGVWGGFEGGLRGPTSKRREGRGGEGMGGSREGRGGEREGREKGREGGLAPRS